MKGETINKVDPKFRGDDLLPEMIHLMLILKSMKNIEEVKEARLKENNGIFGILNDTEILIDPELRTVRVYQLRGNAPPLLIYQFNEE